MSPVAAAVAVAFVPWVQVTPKTMLVTVSEFTWHGPIGAVQSPAWRDAKPVQVGCPEFDETGKVIGYSITCQEYKK